jgi:hypothetical protein
MVDPMDMAAVSALLGRCAQNSALRFTLHAQQEMIDKQIAVADLKEALSAPEIIENYPVHQRGACCLALGQTRTGRFLRVVCTSCLEPVVIITVYEPKGPKWLTAHQRRSP